jgi:phosphopantothenoylcysteine synthetase/decarboxylase
VRILITAGPTREAIDPVRFLSNRSSGKMGYAIAAEALERGHEVSLVSGPVSIAAPAGVDLSMVESASEMFDAVKAVIGSCEVAVMAAAVADYTPAKREGQKIKKGDGEMQLPLVRTKDILGSARGEFQFEGLLVGFAAETENLRANAIEKMQRKGCDLLVGNDVSRADIGLGSDHNEVIVFAADGEEHAVGRRTKAEVAVAIFDLIEKVSGER